MKHLLNLLTLLCCLGGVFSTQALALPRPGQLDDVAGVPGKRGYGGDGGDALRARLGSPMGLAVDARGNIYISDTLNHRVRRVDIRTGEIDTVAGTGKKGFENDGGNADMATLNGPTGLAFDSLGNLYIADTGNNRIRKIDRHSGFLVNVAGNGETGDSGDFDLAQNARLNKPSALVFDSYGNLFIADTGNHQVRWVEPKRHLIFTIAGTGKRGFSGEGDRKCTDSAFSNPTGLAVDKDGRLYISDTDNQRIRRLTVESRMDSKVVTVAGSGERGYNGDGLDAWNTDLAYPGAMVITRHNLLYFVDTGNNLVRRVTAISTVEPPVKYTDYGKPESQPDERSFLQVLFGGGSKKATSKK